MRVSKGMIGGFIAIIVVLFIIGMFAITNEQPSTTSYSLRPLITVRNWTGGEFVIRFPYHEEKYLINYESPFDYTMTELGYDLTIHFIRKEK